jgi:hypothetical protein
MVEAARKYKRIVQSGTQRRSDEGLHEAIEYIREGNLGKIVIVYGIVYVRRGSIGKVDRPQPVPESVDYNLWCGPAPMLPLMRKNLHYDWHWVWPTGDGDFGNNGIHFTDICQWFLAKNTLPPRVMSIGGRFGYIDDGETPNTQIMFFDYKPAVGFFEAEQLKVFDKLPADQINTEIHESFVAKAPEPSVPQSAEEWARQRDEWTKAIREKSFRGWPTETEAGPLDIKSVFSIERKGIRFSAYDFTSQPHVRLRLYTAHRAGLNKTRMVTLEVLDEQEWKEWLAAMRVGFADELDDQTLPEPNDNAFKIKQELFKKTKRVMAYFAPRGIGPTVWNPDERKQTQIRRRFMLLGQTLDGMQVWDLRRAIQAMRTIDSTSGSKLQIRSKQNMAGIVLYASLFEPNIERLDLWNIPNSHRDGPTFLNVLRYLDIPQAVAMAAERSRVRLYQKDDSGWRFPRAVAKKMDWPQKQFQVLTVSNEREP